MNINELLQKAEAAEISTKSRAHWAPLLPVVRRLKNKGFSTWQAISWLVGQNAIPAAQQRAAYHSIVNCIKRADAKAKAAAAKTQG